MRQIFEPSWTPKGTFDPTLEDEGWFDKGLTADAGAAGDATFTTLAGSATAAGGRPGPIIVGSASNNSGTGTSTGATVTLPAGIADGDIAYMVVSMNTQADRGDPTGWTLVEFSTVTSNLLQQKVYRKTVNASDSSTAVSWTLTNAQKWNIAVVVVRRDGGVDVENTAWTSATSSSTTWRLDSITPASDDTLLLGFHAWRVNSSGTTTSSPPTDWSESVETSNNAAAAPTIGVGIDYRELTGGSGVATTTRTDGSYDGATGTDHISLVVSVKALGWTGTATFDTLVGNAPADGGSTTFNGGATFDTVVGTATADGGSSTFTGGATFDSTVGDAPAAGGSSSFTGDSIFDTVAGDAPAAGGSTSFTGDATFDTSAADAPASGGSSAFTGDATFDTVVGTATADGGSTTFDVSGGGVDATFTTTEGTATADGGSSSFTGDATFTTLEGTATASGGDSTFTGDEPVVIVGGGGGSNVGPMFHPPLNKPAAVVTVHAKFGQGAAAAAMSVSGGVSTFTGTVSPALSVEAHNAAVLELV